MQAKPESPLQIARPSPTEAEGAWRLLFDADQSADLDRVRSSPGAAEGLWRARRGGRVVGAVWAQLHPGRCAGCWPPRLVADEPEQTADALLQALLDWLQSQDARLAQTLLATEATADAATLLRAGFEHAADLLYMISLGEHFPQAPEAAGLRFLRTAELAPGQLEELLSSTFEGSLDCPAIDGARSTADCLEGYRATGAFDPKRWLAAFDGENLVGCLLLTDHAEAGHWELVYMGIRPRFRGRGFGLRLVRHAQWLARQAGCERLVLAVDAANAPAVQSYEAAGFASWDRRRVFLCRLPREENSQ